MSTSATSTPFKLNRVRGAERAIGNGPKATAVTNLLREATNGRTAKIADVRPRIIGEPRAGEPGTGTPRPTADFPVSGSASGMNRVHVLHHPIGDHALAALRHRRTPAEQFRLHCQRLLLLLTVEATSSLPVRQRGPGSEAIGRTLGKPVIVLSLTRDGLGLAHQVAETIPDAATGVVTIHGTETDRPEPRLHLVRAPALSEARVILFCPIIATGLSSCLAVSLLRHSGANDISLLSIVASSDGVTWIHSVHPTVEIWTGAVDLGWDPKIGPAPGIGNFAERLYD